MARKPEVEHLRSADRQHYAGSRKLGDHQHTAAERVATLDTPPAPTSARVTTIGQTITDDDLTVEAERCAIAPGEVLIFIVDNDGNATGGLTIDDTTDPAATAATIAGQIGGHARWVTPNTNGSYTYGSTLNG
jgi:hypothetical protein